MPRDLRTVFAVPALLALSTWVALAAALLGEAAGWRWLAWFALGAPLGAIAWRVFAHLRSVR